MGGVKLRFPSYEKALADLRDGKSAVDVDSVLLAVQKSYEMVREQGDTLQFYKEYITTNPHRIHLPGDDYTFFDSFFEGLDTAASSGQLVRIVHYGDSQLEEDRISATIREDLQDEFGGAGPGMMPAIMTVPSMTTSHAGVGALSRYILFGPKEDEAEHTRYGPLAQLAKLEGEASITIQRRKERKAREKAEAEKNQCVLAL